MAQFDVYENPSKASSKHYPYLVDIQNPTLDALNTRIVIPLGKASLFSDATMARLMPVVTLDGAQLILLTPQLAAIPKKNLTSPVGSLAHFRDEILDAMDFAIVGF